MRPLLLNDFIEYTRRRKAGLRWLRFGLFALAITPLGIAWRAKAAHHAPRQVELPLSKSASTREAPWGLFVSTNAVRTWLGALPEAAVRPDATSGPLSPVLLQSEIEKQAGPSIRECYALIASYHGDEVQAPGVLVASVLVRRDGSVDVGVGGDNRLVYAGVASCVDTAISAVRFGQPEPDTEWFHFPIRFVPEPPSS
jgi:hypothetical protein